MPLEKNIRNVIQASELLGVDLFGKDNKTLFVPNEIKGTVKGYFASLSNNQEELGHIRNFSKEFGYLTIKKEDQYKNFDLHDFKFLERSFSNKNNFTTELLILKTWLLYSIWRISLDEFKNEKYERKDTFIDENIQKLCKEIGICDKRFITYLYKNTNNAFHNTKKDLMEDLFNYSKIFKKFKEVIGSRSCNNNILYSYLCCIPKDGKYNEEDVQKNPFLFYNYFSHEKEHFYELEDEVIEKDMIDTIKTLKKFYNNKEINYYARFIYCWLINNGDLTKTKEQFKEENLERVLRKRAIQYPVRNTGNNVLTISFEDDKEFSLYQKVTELLKIRSENVIITTYYDFANQVTIYIRSKNSLKLHDLQGLERKLKEIDTKINCLDLYLGKKGIIPPCKTGCYALTIAEGKVIKKDITEDDFQRIFNYNKVIKAVNGRIGKLLHYNYRDEDINTTLLYELVRNYFKVNLLAEKSDYVHIKSTTRDKVADFELFEQAKDVIFNNFNQGFFKELIKSDYTKQKIQARITSYLRKQREKITEEKLQFLTGYVLFVLSCLPKKLIHYENNLCINRFKKIKDIVFSKKYMVILLCSYVHELMQGTLPYFQEIQKLFNNKSYKGIQNILTKNFKISKMSNFRTFIIEKILMFTPKLTLTGKHFFYKGQCKTFGTNIYKLIEIFNQQLIKEYGLRVYCHISYEEEKLEGEKKEIFKTSKVQMDSINPEIYNQSFADCFDYIPKQVLAGFMLGIKKVFLFHKITKEELSKIFSSVKQIIENIQDNLTLYSYEQLTSPETIPIRI